MFTYLTIDLRPDFLSSSLRPALRFSLIEVMSAGQMSCQSARSSCRVTNPSVALTIATHFAGAIGLCPDNHWLNIPGVTSMLFAKSDWEMAFSSRYLSKFILSSNLAKLNGIVNSHAKYLFI
jgi:hypothetical protein